MSFLPSQSRLRISHADREGENSKCELRGNELLRRRALGGHSDTTNNTLLRPTMGSGSFLSEDE